MNQVWRSLCKPNDLPFQQNFKVWHWSPNHDKAMQSSCTTHQFTRQIQRTQFLSFCTNYTCEHYDQAAFLLKPRQKRQTFIFSSLNIVEKVHQRNESLADYHAPKHRQFELAVFEKKKKKKKKIANFFPVQFNLWVIWGGLARFAWELLQKARSRDLFFVSCLILTFQFEKFAFLNPFCAHCWHLQWMFAQLIWILCACSQHMSIAPKEQHE